MADVILKNRRGDPKEYEEVDGVKLYAEDGHAEVFKQDTSMASVYTYIGKPVVGGIQIMGYGGVMKSSNAALVQLTTTQIQEWGVPGSTGGYISWFVVSSSPLVIGNVYSAYDILIGRV